MASTCHCPATIQGLVGSGPKRQCHLRLVPPKHCSRRVPCSLFTTMNTTLAPTGWACRRRAKQAAATDGPSLGWLVRGRERRPGGPVAVPGRRTSDGQRQHRPAQCASRSSSWQPGISPQGSQGGGGRQQGRRGDRSGPPAHVGAGSRSSGRRGGFPGGSQVCRVLGARPWSR